MCSITHAFPVAYRTWPGPSWKIETLPGTWSITRFVPGKSLHVPAPSNGGTPSGSGAGGFDNGAGQPMQVTMWATSGNDAPVFGATAVIRSTVAVSSSTSAKLGNSRHSVTPGVPTEG